MAQKKHKPEEIVGKLRQVDVLLSQGRPVADPPRQHPRHEWRQLSPQAIGRPPARIRRGGAKPGRPTRCSSRLPQAA